MMFNMTKILIFMGIIGIIKISLIVSIKGLSYDNPKPNNDTRLIVCIVDYDNFVQLSGSWGYEKDYTDNSSVYSLFDYTDHANSFTEFINKYPTVTISTSGKAISESTFGDVGRNKFGKLNYPTTNFAVKDHVHHVDIVNSYLSKLLTYYIRVNIGIGFKREGTMLCLVPYINRILRSRGNYERYLDFGFSIKTITFNPKNGKRNSKIRILNAINYYM